MKVRRLIGSVALLLCGLGAVGGGAARAATTAGTEAATIAWTTSSQTIGSASPLTLSVTVAASAASATAAPTGTVEFVDETNSATLGTATLNASGAASATIAAGALAAGAHSIDAVYQGDTNFASATSAAIAITVKNSVSLTLASNASTAGSAQAVILTATATPVTVAAGETNPTGAVYFYLGTTAVGSADLVPGPGNSALATLSATSLPAGTDSITAVYQGDTYYAPATSQAVTVAVQGFAIAPAATNPANNLNIVQGGSGSARFLVAGLGGFSGDIHVVCSVPAQNGMSCTVDKQDVTPPDTVTVTVQTYKPGQSAANSRKGQPWTRGTAWAALVAFLLPFGLRAGRFKRAMRTLTLLLSVAGLCSAGIGCGSVSGTAQNSGTPLGVGLPLTITAAANVDNAAVSHSVYLTVNVTP